MISLDGSVEDGEGSRNTHGSLAFPRPRSFVLNSISDILGAEVIAVVFNPVATLVFDQRLTLQQG